MAGTGGIPDHLLLSLWLPSWHLETRYSAIRQVGPYFSCGPGPRHCGWWLRATQQTLEDSGQLCRVCVRAARAAGLFPARAEGDGLEEASLVCLQLSLPTGYYKPWNYTLDLGWHDSLDPAFWSPERQAQATPETLHTKTAVKNTGSGVRTSGCKPQFYSLSAGPITLPG